MQDATTPNGYKETWWEEAVVYNQEQRSESVAWTLYKDGIRSLSLRPGVEDTEIVRFLAVLHKAKNLKGALPLTKANPDLVSVVHKGEVWAAVVEKQDGDNYQVRGLCNVDVRDSACLRLVEKVGQHGIPGERPKSGRSDKLCGMRRQHNVDVDV